MSDPSNKVDRRTVLQSMGVGAATTAIGVGTVSAADSESGPDWTYEELDGQDKWSLLDTLSETNEYNQLHEFALENGNRPVISSSRAGRLSTEDVTREIFSIELRSHNVDEAYLTIGRDIGDGVSIAQVEYNTLSDDGLIKKHVVYDALGDGRSSTHVSTQSSDSEFEKRVVTPEEETRATMKSIENRMQSGGVTTQAVGDGPCDECKWAVPLVCQNVCGAAGGFACGFLGIISGGIGGVGCLTIVNVTCAFASTYGCTGSLADRVCEEEVNLC